MSRPAPSKPTLRAPMPYQPDYEIEHTKSEPELTRFGWLVFILAAVAFSAAFYFLYLR